MSSWCAELAAGHGKLKEAEETKTALVVKSALGLRFLLLGVANCPRGRGRRGRRRRKSSGSIVHNA